MLTFQLLQEFFYAPCCIFLVLNVVVLKTESLAIASADNRYHLTTRSWEILRFQTAGKLKNGSK